MAISIQTAALLGRTLELVVEARWPKKMSATDQTLYDRRPRVSLARRQSATRILHAKTLIATVVSARARALELKSPPHILARPQKKAARPE